MGRKVYGSWSYSFADALSDLKPDLLLILGDRFEIFAAASITMAVVSLLPTYMVGKLLKVLLMKLFATVLPKCLIFILRLLNIVAVLCS